MVQNVIDRRLKSSLQPKKCKKSLLTEIVADTRKGVTIEYLTEPKTA